MTWLSSFLIAVLSGTLGLFCAGGIASLCVEWYRVSSFEGKSGYFVVFTALLGGLAAFVIGLIAARFVAAGVAPSFLKGLGFACGAVLAIALVALALCRLLADPAPELDGKSLGLEPPPPDPATVRAAEFAALKPDASLEQLLPFLFEGPTPERTAVVTKAIAERQPELASLIRSTNETAREYALRAVSYATPPAPELVEAVLAEGRAIADGIRQFNALPETDPGYNTAPDLRSRFNEWKHAWWIIAQELGVDGRPPVQEIRDLAAVRDKDTTMHEIELNARTVLEHLNKTAAQKKP